MAYSTRKLSLVSEQDAEAEETPHLSDASRPLGTVAATLRAARLAHGSTLPEIADSLRIRLSYLEAIEDGRFSDLPGTVYAIGFIRTYADHLGLDAQHLVKKFKEEVQEPEEEKELHFLAAEPERRIPGGSLMLVALLLGAVTYGVWFYVSSTDRTLVDLIPEFPDRFNALLQSEPLIGEEGEIAAPVGPDGTLMTEDQPDVAALDLPMQTDVPGSPPEEGSLAQPGTPLSLSEDAPAPLPAPAEPGLAAEAPVASGTADPLLLPQPGSEPQVAAIPEAPIGEPPAAPQALGEEPLTALPAPELSPELAPMPADPATESGQSIIQNTGEQAAADTPVPAAESFPDEPSVATIDQQDLEAPDQVPGQSAAIAAARPPGPPESATFGGENADSRVMINATAMSWVQVRDGTGNLVMTRVLQPGESYRVPNRSGLQMVTGNAGGIEIFVDGQPTPSLGRPGDVVRNIDLTPDALLNGTAVPN